jgi:hypothetical protein
MDRQREDYADGPRPAQRPTLAESAPGDPVAGGATPRQRVSVSAVIAFAAFGVFRGLEKALAEWAGAARLGQP